MSNIPTFGVGTFRLNGQVVIDSVRNALDVATALSTRHRSTATRPKSARPSPRAACSAPISS